MENSLMYSGIKENLSKSYDEKSAERNDTPTQDWKVKERDVFYSFLEKENKTSHLEIGARTGRDSLFFKGKGLKTLSTDLSSESVELCREKGLHAEVMSFDDLSLTDGQFESIWALNCLLHVPKQELSLVLKEIKRVLAPGGQFYIGVYGGVDFKGIWEGDHYEPKRFFSFYEDNRLTDALSDVFIIEYFKRVPKEVVGGAFDFQSIILRKGKY
ncbi:MAG: class I SAM-dependent methyltransferase [Bacillota bacterium]